MYAVLQPILVPINGAPDIILSIDPNSPDELFVFLGMALLEKVPHLMGGPQGQSTRKRSTVNFDGI